MCQISLTAEELFDFEEEICPMESVHLQEYLALQ